MFPKLVVWLGLCLYAALSVADWMMTYALLRMHPDAVEANPLAAACLDIHGWSGLAVYKAGGVLMFVGAVFLLVRRRPGVAVGVVAFGCTVLLSVTVYTHGLIRDAQECRNMDWPRPTASHDAVDGVPVRCWFASDAPTSSRPGEPKLAAR